MKKQMEELSKKTAPELAKLLAEKREELRTFRFGMKGSRTRDTKVGRNLRKDIARTLTLQNARDDEQAPAETK
jgi:ribosomal protein L29